MATHSKECLIILSLLLIGIGILEITRGYSILKGRRYYPSLTDSLRIKIFNDNGFDKTRNEANDQSIITKEQKMSAYNSLFGGITFVVLFTIMFVYAIVN